MAGAKLHGANSGECRCCVEMFRSHSGADNAASLSLIVAAFAAPFVSGACEAQVKRMSIQILQLVRLRGPREHAQGAILMPRLQPLFVSFALRLRFVCVVFSNCLCCVFVSFAFIYVLSPSRCLFVCAACSFDEHCDLISFCILCVAFPFRFRCVVFSCEVRVR